MGTYDEAFDAAITAADAARVGKTRWVGAAQGRLDVPGVLGASVGDCRCGFGDTALAYDHGSTEIFYPGLQAPGCPH